MNNAIGLNLQTAPAVETPQVISVQPVAVIQGCQNGDCAGQEGGFLELLNTELNALVDIESQDLIALEGSQLLENIEEIDELSNIDVSNSILSELLQQEEEPAELLSLVASETTEMLDSDLQQLEAEFKQALAELPEEITALPLTPENKALIEQRVLAQVKLNNPELMAQIKQTDGQTLPLEGKLLPLVEEVLAKQSLDKSAQVTSLGSGGIAQNMLEKDINSNGKSKEASIVSLEESDLDSDIDKGFKNVFDQNDSDTDFMKQKSLVENMLNKSASQSDTVPQKFSTEALSTSINNVLGANQASINTPTPSAVQSGSTLLLPQNPSPEQWGSALGDKVQWMVNGKMDSAEIRIDPPHLGKLDISIKMTDDGANVVIQTQHAATRELIDAASYRLKEMLEQAGHEQVNVDVSHKESNQSEKQMADNDGFNNQHASSHEDNQDAMMASTENILSATFNERPRLDLFV